MTIFRAGFLCRTAGAEESVPHFSGVKFGAICSHFVCLLNHGPMGKCLVPHGSAVFIC
jgi:hypothetical protein